MLCHLLRKGSGIPFVFLHGFLGSGLDWDLVASYLPGKTCISFDLPGHGQTFWYSDDLFALLFPKTPFHLVGYSLGGRLAMRFAFSHPELIQSLTLLSTHYGLETEEKRKERLRLDQKWVQKLQTKSFDQFLQDWYSQEVFSSLEGKINSVISMRKNNNPKTLAKALIHWSLGHQSCYRDQLRSFSRPLCILFGALDLKFKSLYQGWPQAIEIPKAGHCLHLEAPKIVAEVLCKQS